VDKQSIDSLLVARTKREKNRIARSSRKRFAQCGITQTRYLSKLPCTLLVRSQYRSMYFIGSRGRREEVEKSICNCRLDIRVQEILSIERHAHLSLLEIARRRKTRSAERQITFCTKERETKE
jgi:hypothetical protein